ncbi:RNA polymerase sigma factor [Botrimarina colliarenosi]|uniref:RNA polymerase sigma factor n=1 Tax=Botrimarina colliarenosi TaxID=2528001 RepID=A0A5C6AJK8_9BACT|nr:sigma-70 family RNA polymerase sigma factor [Botrimarina colliarenosi]TWU00235.1 RNA polymerase sigma factor [Botrimarina colliarenosi]
MAFSPIDRDLLDSLLGGNAEAWPQFVDRFLALISHVVSHAADCRGVRLTAADREDLIADVFVTLLERDKAALRRFQRRSSLATYLTVIARRVVVRRLMQRAGQTPVAIHPAGFTSEPTNGEASAEQRVADSDQVNHMLGGLSEPDAQVVRMYHLEGRSYNEISRAVGLPVNTIGPVLSRARQRLRQQGGSH